MRVSAVQADGQQWLLTTMTPDLRVPNDPPIRGIEAIVDAGLQ